MILLYLQGCYRDHFALAMLNESIVAGGMYVASVPSPPHTPLPSLLHPFVISQHRV